MMSLLKLYASVPLTSFRVSHAREFWESYSCPPPSTVYGMLLSLIGEEDRLVHRGANIAIAMLTEPEKSIILRSMWRIKTRKKKQGTGENVRPDFQEILSDVQFIVFIGENEEHTGHKYETLFERLNKAFTTPSSISRYGGLSLGESTFLVDSVRRCSPDEKFNGWWLRKNDRGTMTLPIWVDHVSSVSTIWSTFLLDGPQKIDGQPPDDSWITISDR